MNALLDQCALLQELDARQDDVLEKLEELNKQVEDLLNECLASRDSPVASAVGGESPTSVGQLTVIHAGPGAPISQSPGSTEGQPVG